MRRNSDLITDASQGFRARFAAGDQHVAGAADAADLRQAVLAETELATQVADVRIDAAIIGREPASEHALGQRLARLHLADRAHQHFEQPQLRAGEPHRLAGQRDFERRRIEPQRPDAHRMRRRVGIARRETPQHGAHARDQLARIERLRQVVVGAQLETDDAIDVGAVRGEHDHRHRQAVAQPAQHLEAAERGQHHVEDHQVERMRLLGEPLERLGAVAHQRHLEALAGQVLGEHLAELAVVVDDQQGGRQGHGRKVRFFAPGGR